MENNGSCLGGVADTNNYASPMPAIGVYIAASTLVCLLLLSCDILQGYRHKKLWFPCRFFSLNSFTLTLLGVATKISVDLTTPMPSAPDQISKICATVLITISMTFFTPGLIEMEGYQLWGNLASLAILVVTVTVDVAIQMSTGVIFSSFYIEHVITVAFMLLTLVAVLNDALYLAITDRSMLHLRDDIERMKNTPALQEYYSETFVNNVQLLWLKETATATFTGTLCTLSFVVTLEACFRALLFKKLKFCGGESDYRWSMWIIVVAQILTLVIGTLAINSRWLVFVIRHSVPSIMVSFKELSQFKDVARITLARDYLPWSFRKMAGFMKILEGVEELVIYFLFLLQLMMTWTRMFLSWLVSSAFTWRERNIDIDDYLKLKAAENVESWTERCRKSHPDHLINILAKTPRSSVEDHDDLQEGGSCCLFFLFLVQIATILMPFDLTESLVHGLDDAFEIVYFFDQQSSKFEDKLKRKVARDLWMRRDSHNNWFQKKALLKNFASSSSAQTSYSSDHANYVIREFTMHLSREFSYLELGDEIHRLRDQLLSKPIGALRDLHDTITQVFVDKLYLVVDQVPTVVANYLLKSSGFDLEKNALVALKLMCKLDLFMPGLVKEVGGGGGIQAEAEAETIAPFGTENVEDNGTEAGSSEGEIDGHVIDFGELWKVREESGTSVCG